MASKTVNDFARELKLAPELLLEQLRAAGVISGDDITTEAAVTKLMYVMGKNLTPNYRYELMARPVKGEFTL